jgi:archaellum biogenesis protein FlaJ (TadC family)
MNRPDPVTFAEGSYILAFASALIIMLAFILGLHAFDSMAMLRQIVWLALITSGVGVFLSFAARQDFKRYSGPEDAVRKARVGWRVNLAVLVFMLIVTVIAIIRGLGVFSAFGT